MNTVEGLKALPHIIKLLLDKRDELQTTIDECYRPFREIIQEVFLVDGYLYVDDIDIGVGDENVSFALRYRSDDECEGTYSYPIEMFVSTDTLRKYIEGEKVRKEQEKNALAEYKERMANKHLEDIEREQYEKLKKKFEQPLHDKLGMDERDLHYRGT